MRRLSAVICLFVMLFCCSCGTGLPEPQGPVSIEDIKFNIKDSRVQAYLSENCQIDAEIGDSDISKLQSYNLYNARLSEGTITGALMPAGGFEIKDNDDGSVEYSRDKEKLIVDLDEKTDDPYIEYIRDTDKAYPYISMLTQNNENTVEDTELEPIKLVKEKLDKLPIEYKDDFRVNKVSVVRMNEFYADLVKDQKQAIDNGSFAYLNEEALDENFKFTDGDDCYVIGGRMILHGLQVYDPLFTNMTINNIEAVVSSRGLEYLSICPFYSAEDANHEVSVIPVEKALKTFCLAYSENDEAKESYDIKVYKVCLSYTMNDLTADGALKGTIDPVWTVCYSIRPLGKKDAIEQYRVCQINAEDGTLKSIKETLFGYMDPDDVQEDDEDNVPAEDLA